MEIRLPQKPFFNNRAYYGLKPPASVMFYDDFEATPLKWGTANGTFTRDTAGPYIVSGSANAKLVTGAVAGNAADMEKSLDFPGLKDQFLSMEFWFTVQNAADTTLRDIVFLWDIFDGATQYVPYVRYLKNLSTPQNLWQYSKDGGSSWVAIPNAKETIDTTFGVPCWVKMTFNLKTSMFGSLFTSRNPTGYPINDSFFTQASANLPRFRPYIQIHTDAAFASTIYIDDVVVGFEN